MIIREYNCGGYDAGNFDMYIYIYVIFAEKDTDNVRFGYEKIVIKITIVL